MGDDHQGLADQTRNRAHTQLFLVRVWEEQRGLHAGEWCGRVQHVIRGEAYSFVGWETLKHYLEAMLASPAGPAEGPAKAHAPEAPESP